MGMIDESGSSSDMARVQMLRSHVSPHILFVLEFTIPLLTLNFLFVGLYKNFIIFPIDATILAAALLCGSLFSFALFGSLRFSVRDPILLALMLIVIYLAIRTPSSEDWAVRKLMELVLFGLPAFWAGHVISANEKMLAWLTDIISALTLPFALLLVWQTFDNPSSFATIGSGGYQLSGMFMALALVASAASSRPLIFAVAFAGVCATGHLSGFLFGTFSALLVWLLRRDYRGLTWALVFSVAIVIVQTVTIGLPLAFQRVGLKTEAVTLLLEQRPDLLAREFRSGRSQENANPFNEESQDGRETLQGDLPTSGLTLIPPVTQEPEGLARSANRILIWRDAIQKFYNNPFLGAGWGSVDYIGHAYPHNIILELASETGIIGVFTFLFLISASFYRSYINSHYFAFGLLCTILLFYMVSGYFGSRLLLFAIGIAAGANIVAKRREKFRP
jgi:hypothetical protein